MDEQGAGFLPEWTSGPHSLLWTFLLCPHSPRSFIQLPATTSKISQVITRTFLGSLLFRGSGCEDPKPSTCWSQVSPRP